MSDIAKNTTTARENNRLTDFEEQIFRANLGKYWGEITIVNGEIVKVCYGFEREIVVEKNSENFESNCKTIIRFIYKHNREQFNHLCRQLSDGHFKDYCKEWEQKMQELELLISYHA